MLPEKRVGPHDNTRTVNGQLFVFIPFPVRDKLIALGLPLLLLVAACSSPAEKAAQEAALAQTLYDADNMPLARAAMNRALAHGARSPEVVLLDARIRMRMQEWNAGYDAYRTLLIFQPDNLEALAVVAQIGSMIGEEEVARDAITRALAIDPDNADVLLTAGVLALRDDDPAEALRIAGRILAFAPGDGRGLALKARGLTLTGRGGEALASTLR